MKACLRLLEDVTTALRKYPLDHAVYPKSGNAGMVWALLDGYLSVPENFINRSGELLDPWGRPVVYENDGRTMRRGMVEAPKGSFVLYSRGPDGRSRIAFDKSGNSRRRPRSWQEMRVISGILALALLFVAGCARTPERSLDLDPDDLRLVETLKAAEQGPSTWSPAVTIPLYPVLLTADTVIKFSVATYHYVRAIFGGTDRTLPVPERLERQAEKIPKN